jgi:flagellar biosynthesis protein FliP
VIGTDLLRLGAAFAVTLGLLAIAIRLLRRLQQGVPPAGGRFTLRVLDRVALGPRQGVTLVQVGGRVLVVAVAEGTPALLAELEGEERERALASPPAPARALPAFAPFPALPDWAHRRSPMVRRAAGGRGPLAGLRLFALAFALALACAGGSADAQTTPTTRPPARAGAAPGTPAQRAAALAAARAPRTRPLAVSPPTSPAPATPRARLAPGPSPLTVEPPVPPQVEVKLGEGKDALHLSGTVGLVVFLGVLTLLPALFLLMTSFTRILIVLHFVRSAIGAQTAPPGQLLVAIAVLLTGVVMNPALQTANRDAVQPYFEGRLTQVEAYQKAVVPFREFMLANTREKDLALFAELSGAQDVRSAEELPIVTVVSAFVTSELRTSFQMGFVIFLPFVVVDLIVASVLMSMGMFMLPPAMISLPFKLLLFVLADGWTLVVQNLVASFR